MKSFLKFQILLLIVVPNVLFGQLNNFEFVQYDTDYVGSDEFIVLHGDIFNLAGTDQSITVTRVTHQKPATWVSSICVGPVCLPDFIGEFTFTLFAEDTALFSLDTYPNEEAGVGSWTIFAVDSSTMEIDSVNLTLEYVTVSIDEDIKSPKSFNLSAIYPNPSNALINFDLNIENSGEYVVYLYSLDGREITKREYSLRSGKNKLQWGMTELPSGNYILRASGEGLSHTRQVSIVK